MLPNQQRTPEISLALCTYGPAQALHLLLQSLRLQECAYELLIVDQNSDVRVPNLLEAYPDIPYRLLRSAPGLSRARNVALRCVAAPIVAFPDDDCAYPPATLRRVVDFFQSTSDAGILAGSSADIVEVLQRRAAVLSGERVSRIRLLPSTQSHMIFVNHSKLKNTDCWKQFDEDLGLGTMFGAAEETDYLYRLTQAGAKAYRTREVVNFHPNKDLDLRNMNRSKSYGLGAGAFLRKHATSSPVFAYLALRAFAGPAMRAALRLVKGDKAGATYYAQNLKARVIGFLSWSSEEKRDLGMQRSSS